MTIDEKDSFVNHEKMTTALNMVTYQSFLKKYQRR